jgi:hypothetical protein
MRYAQFLLLSDYATQLAGFDEAAVSTGIPLK